MIIPGSCNLLRHETLAKEEVIRAAGIMNFFIREGDHPPSRQR
jgi:hypothetical protein